MAKRKPVSPSVGKGHPGEPPRSSLPLAPGTRDADARGAAHAFAEALFQATLRREGLEEDQLVWFTGDDDEIRFRCPSRGVTTISLRLARAGRIVAYESQVPSEGRLWHLLAAAQLCSDVLDAPKPKPVAS